MDVATTVVVGVIALIAGFLAGSLLRGRTETGAARHELDLTLALAETGAHVTAVEIDTGHLAPITHPQLIADEILLAPTTTP